MRQLALGLLFLFLPVRALAVVALVQESGVTLPGVAGGTTCITPSKTVTNGNLIVVVVWEGNESVSSIADTLTDSFTRAGSRCNTGSSGAEIWYGVAKSTGANAVTVTYNASNVISGCGFSEWSGMPSASGLQATGTCASASSTTVTSGTLTPNKNVNLIIGSAGQLNPNTVTTIAGPSGGFKRMTTDITTNPLYLPAYAVGLTGSLSYAYTTNGLSNRSGGGLLAEFIVATPANEIMP